MRFDVKDAHNGHAAPIDWDRLRGEIVARLDVAAEYEALGVEFTRPAPNGKGLRECRAFGRRDDEPSAFVNVRTGVYHDSGGDGCTLGLFNFALRHGGGKWGRYADVVRHYAGIAGVPFGAVKYGSRGKVLEEVYPYHDEAGRLVFGVHRYRLPNGDKTFRQYPWRNGDWFRAEGCMEGVPLYPYRLPELLAADPAEAVWIVEGEKDVERLRKLGFVATCNPMGAGKWREEFSRRLEGRPCVVVPDNDPPGRQHAAKVAGTLAGVATSIKVLDLPGLPFRGDVSDWLDAGGTPDELGHLAHGAPEWSPAGGDRPAAEEDLSRDATVADLRACQSLDSWTWPLWIPNAALTLLAAEPGMGKTRFCFDLCRRIYHGIPWPDGTPMTIPAGGRSLWVVADNQWQEMCDLAAEFAIPDGAIVLNAKASDPYAGTSLQTEEELADLEARIARVRPAIAIIDTITNTGDFKAQDSSDAKRQYKPLQEIAAKSQSPIMCVTHLNAGGKVLGRRAVEKVRVVIQLEHPDPDGQPDRRKLYVSKSKAIKPPPLGMTMGDAGNEYDAHPPEPPGPARFDGATTGPPPVRTAECMKWLADQLSPGKARVSAIRTRAEQAGHSAKTLYRARDLLRAIETEEDGRKWWALPEAAHVNGEDRPPF